MNFVINILLILDGLVFLMVILDSFSKKEPKILFQAQSKAMGKVTDDAIEEMKQEERKTKRISYFIGGILAILILLLFYTSVFWIPIYLWIRFGFDAGLAGYVVTNFFMSVFIFRMKVRKIGIKNLKESQPVFLVVSNIFRILLLVVVYFGWSSGFQESMIQIYDGFENFNYFFVVFYPVIIIGIVITNIYALFNGMLMFNKNQQMSSEWRTNIKDILLIFVISSFLGIIYLSDNNLSFIKEEDMGYIEQNIEIIKIFLTAIFIPLLFDKIVSKKSKDPAEVEIEVEKSINEELLTGSQEEIN